MSAEIFKTFSGRVLEYVDIAAALRQVRASQLAEFESDSLPAVTWADVGGCAEVTRYFDEMLTWPLEHAHTMQVCWEEKKKTGSNMYKFM